MQDRDFYANAHLVVAAIRVLEHQKAIPPSIDVVCKTLSVSLEQGNMICRKLNDMGIIEVVEGAYGTRLFVLNHLKLEEIPKETKGSSLEEAVKQFQNSKKGIIDKVASLRADQAEKKKSLFAELENKLKKGLEKK